MNSLFPFNEGCQKSYFSDCGFGPLSVFQKFTTLRLCQKQQVYLNVLDTQWEIKLHQKNLKWEINSFNSFCVSTTEKLLQSDILQQTHVNRLDM